MRVMVVVMVASQHERLKVRDDGQTVNSKNLMRTIGFRNATAEKFRNVRSGRPLESGQVKLSRVIQWGRFCETDVTLAGPEVPPKPEAYCA